MALQLKESEMNLLAANDLILDGARKSISRMSEIIHKTRVKAIALGWRSRILERWRQRRIAIGCMRLLLILYRHVPGPQSLFQDIASPKSLERVTLPIVEHHSIAETFDDSTQTMARGNQISVLPSHSVSFEKLSDECGTNTVNFHLLEMVSIPVAAFIGEPQMEPSSNSACIEETPQDLMETFRRQAALIGIMNKRINQLERMRRRRAISAWTGFYYRKRFLRM